MEVGPAGILRSRELCPLRFGNPGDYSEFRWCSWNWGVFRWEWWDFDGFMV